MDRQKLKELRSEKEQRCGRGFIDGRNKTVYIENIPYVFGLGKKLLASSGIYNKWHKNALDVQIRHESWKFASLPAGFEDYKILQVTDLHIDALPELSQILPELIKNLSFDLCIFTGDFRFDIHCSDQRIDGLLEPVIKAAGAARDGVLGILGNHDYLDYTLENVEKLGLRFLLNESMEVEREGGKILITGLDDVHFYRTGRLFDQRAQARAAQFKLLLVHSPELYREAAQAGYDLYLCGHTHGGQICLPGGIPLLTNCRTGRKYVKGRWQHKKLQGFTSSGAGASGIPLRWNCAPEIVIHHLERKK